MDYEAKQNMYEPIEHLAGCEDLIAQHYEEKRQNAQKDAEFEAAAPKRRSAQRGRVNVQTKILQIRIK